LSYRPELASLQYYDSLSKRSLRHRHAPGALRITSPAVSAQGVRALVEHTVKTFDRELEALERRIVEMGGIAKKMVIDAIDALAKTDAMLAHEVVAADLRLDALQREIEKMAVTTIARRQPVARLTCASSLAPSASPATSSGSAISPRILPSAR
jgi:hypothetical protein